ncbi:hypothetical protein NXW50_15910 [Bacteroides thetaiotaomicron]|nr:hypothetical protein [Bacteroides thetaiotaomicron]MCS2279616.1 hypothetical protein [Bacteroides thetaiotaomicron]
MTLLYSDRDTGEDFTDSPNVNSRKNKGANTGVDCHQSCRIMGSAVILRLSGTKP